MKRNVKIPKWRNDFSLKEEKTWTAQARSAYKSTDAIKTELETLYTHLCQNFKKNSATFQQYSDRLSACFQDKIREVKNDHKYALSMPGAMVRDDLNTGTLTFPIFMGFTAKAGFKNYSAFIADAYLFCLESEYAVAQGDQSVAQNTLESASAACALCWANFDNEYHSSDRKEKSRKGGHARFKKKYGPVIEYTYDLMKKRTPAGGWSSASAAAAVLLPEIEKFCADSAIETSYLNFEDTIAKWIRRIPNLRNQIPRLRNQKIKS